MGDNGQTDQTSVSGGKLHRIQETGKTRKKTQHMVKGEQMTIFWTCAFIADLIAIIAIVRELKRRERDGDNS